MHEIQNDIFFSCITVFGLSHMQKIILQGRECMKHIDLMIFDFDGTLAENGSVPPALQAALERLLF